MTKSKASKYKRYYSLDSILKIRFHGAVNIKGVRYQILFSIYKALEESGVDPNFLIHLEGIEDLDLIEIKINNKFIQVKSSTNKWNWAKYKDVFRSFYEVYSLNDNSQFYLVTDFAHNDDWLKITGGNSLSKKEKQRLEEKIKSINNDLGITDLKLYKCIKLITLDEKELYTSIKKYLLSIYKIASEKMAEIFIDSLFSEFLGTAEKREFIRKSLLDDIWRKINEQWVKQQEFSAMGDGLISKIEWQVDDKKDDFYDGKRVRSGHIEAQLDIQRTKWLDQIDKGINGSNVCIIKASSGQGKSTLLFRYAHDFWDDKYIYILKSAINTKEVELVKDFLNYLRKMHLPILLLVDNADFQIALWPEIAGFCSGIGIRVLVTIRHEDWFRFSNSFITNYEIIQPELDFKEAKEIYDTFFEKNRIHNDVVSYQWAFEKIGEPRLLLEYVYLLTHGEMLKERLNKQINYISEKEIKSKVELLRLISTADLLGSPIAIDKILEETSFESDPQFIIGSLDGEYIEIRNGFLQGLHWIRSKHLSDLLHDRIFHMTDTAIKLLKLIPENNLAYYISNCIYNENIDNDKILNYLNSNIENYPLKIIEHIFKGLFLGGEHLFFFENRKHFEEAFNLLGHAGVFLLGTSTTPTNMINAIENLAAIKTNENIEKLRIILSKITYELRGILLCKKFAGLIENEKVAAKFIKDSLLEAPDIFYWLKIVGIKLETSFFEKQFSEIKKFENYDEKGIYRILSGLYEYDQDKYFEWYHNNCNDFHSFLQYKTDTIELKLQNNEILITFIELNDNISLNEQAVSRLDKYREALPFCSKYSSHAITVLPFGLEPSVKDTEKSIPVQNLPLNFYVMLNRYWLDIGLHP